MAKVCILIPQFGLFLTLFLFFSGSFYFLIRFCCQRGLVGLLFVVINNSQGYLIWLCIMFSIYIGFFIFLSVCGWQLFKGLVFLLFGMAVWVHKGFLYPVLVPSHVNMHKHFCIKGNSILLPLFIFLLNFLVACQVKN